MAICSGRGDTNGGHCCWIDGELCAYLDQSGPVPRCKLWGKMFGPRWEKSLAGKYFAEHFPGKTCEDWPQNIPAVMANPNVGKCCWNPPVKVEIS